MLKKRQIKELKTRNKIDRVNELGVRFPNRKAFHGFHIQGEWKMFFLSYTEFAVQEDWHEVKEKKTIKLEKNLPSFVSLNSKIS